MSNTEITTSRAAILKKVVPTRREPLANTSATTAERGPAEHKQSCHNYQTVTTTSSPGQPAASTGAHQQRVRLENKTRTNRPAGIIQYRLYRYGIEKSFASKICCIPLLAFSCKDKLSSIDK